MLRFMFFRMTKVTLISLLLLSIWGCSNQSSQSTNTGLNPLKEYVSQKDPTFKFDLHKIIEGYGYKTHILRMVSGQWLTSFCCKTVHVSLCLL